GVTPGSCATCHGVSSTGLPTNHKGGTNRAAACDSCHRTTGWIPATMNHTVVAATPCSTCHNNTLSRGIPAGHRGGMTAGACSNCHRTTAWTPATFSHTGVTPGTCATCHNGTNGVTGKPANHIPSTQSCDVCHRNTTAFSGSRYHASVTAIPGQCNTCHERGTTWLGVQGKRPSQHSGSRAAPNSCDNSGCHRVGNGF
ncbi:MAG: cytochrome c3 family protein, partial [Nitrospira sp.]|nr:cytochrome c3 family protein [Nitrospira sp.]